MQAIVTRVIPESATKPTRIKAECNGGSVVVSADQYNHDDAVSLLLVKLEWNGDWVSGALPKNKGNVYVCTDDPKQPPVPRWFRRVNGKEV